MIKLLYFTFPSAAIDITEAIISLSPKPTDFIGETNFTWENTGVSGPLPRSAAPCVQW